jgi:hypothetical protein
MNFFNLSMILDSVILYSKAFVWVDCMLNLHFGVGEGRGGGIQILCSAAAW